MNSYDVQNITMVVYLETRALLKAITPVDRL